MIKNNLNLKYNLKLIKSISVTDWRQSPWYVYKKKKSFLGMIITGEGIYEESWGSSTLLDELPANHVMRDELILEVPHCTIKYTNGDSQEFYFSSLDDAYKFQQEVINLTTIYGIATWANDEMNSIVNSQQ